MLLQRDSKRYGKAIKIDLVVKEVINIIKTKRTIFNPITNNRQNVFDFIEFLCERKLLLFEKIMLEWQFNKEKISIEINNDYDYTYVLSKIWNKIK